MDIINNNIDMSESSGTISNFVCDIPKRKRGRPRKNDQQEKGKSSLKSEEIKYRVIFSTTSKSIIVGEYKNFFDISKDLDLNICTISSILNRPQTKYYGKTLQIQRVGNALKIYEESDKTKEAEKEKKRIEEKRAKDENFFKSRQRVKKQVEVN